MNYIPRPNYSNRIKPFIGKQIIKVLTGQRRVGKSYVMLHLMDIVKELCPQANIIYINRELESFWWIKTHKDLYDYVKEKIDSTTDNFLFIDEIQDIADFQLALRSLFAENLCDITCTGSNANMLSGELATFLSGRYIEFSIHTLTFEEFLLFHKLENNQAALLKYISFGGMPYLANIPLVDNLPFEYLRSIYSTILLKDVVAREGIRNVAFLENLVMYLADNVGNLFSANNISKFLKSQQINLTPSLTISYLKALTNAFLVHRVPRTDIVGLKVFEIGEKYYFEDIGLRNAIVGFNQKADLHKILENVIYLHLIANGFIVKVGQIGSREIDFVAEKNGDKIYVQVALQITDEQTEKREFGNLLQIQDNYPKYVVVFNDLILGNNYQGIKYCNLIDFLNMKI